MHSLPTLQLTIDARIQRAADKAVRDGIALARANGHSDAQAGAAVVMNPRTGAIYALSSYPTYNQVAAAHDPKYLASLYTDRGANPRLLNQATQGVYPTGSTFKPIVAEAALSEGIITPSTPQLCTRLVHDRRHDRSTTSRPAIFESMTLPTALAQSCDTWFYRLGDKFFLRGSQGIQRWAKLLGLGHPTGFDVPGEVARARPDARVARRRPSTAVVRGPDDQPLDRPGLPPGDAAAARGRVFRARERRHRRPAARRARRSCAASRCRR